MLRRYALLLLSLFSLLGSASAQSAPQPTPSANPPAYLQQAFYGVNTLQSWYMPSTGLYQTTGYWNAGNALTVLANYSRLDGTDAYFPIFANTLQQTPKAFPGFLDGYYDDEGWWALAWIDVYDVTKKPEYLATASSIFTDMAGAWDNTCGGGVWWNSDHKYKNAITNELFLSVASSLAARATDPNQRAMYLNWAQREWAWFQGSGMINAQNQINDGLDTATCKNNQQTVWSYNQGVILGGLTQLYALTNDNTLIASAKSIADATLTHLTDANGVLHDVCEPNCGGDGPQFKGVFLRNLVPLQGVVQDPKYKIFADTNAESIWNKSQGPNYQFGVVWSGPFDSGNAASQGSALDAILAAAAMEPNGSGSAPAFTLTASPSTLNLTSGTSQQTTLSLTPGNYFTGSVDLIVTPIGAPAGVQATLGSTSLSANATTTLSVSTTGATPGGNYLIAVTGVSGGLSRTVYIKLALPDFSIQPATGKLFLNQAGTVSDLITVSDSNGFAGDVSLALSSLPPQVKGRFSPPSTATTSTLTLKANMLTPTSSGTPFTITGSSGATTHTLPPLSVAVSAAASDCGFGTSVSLASAFNLTALRNDGVPFNDGGLDGVGGAYSATLLGPARVLNGIHYRFGAHDTSNAIYAAGQTITLPAGHFNTLQFLGTAIGGDQNAQTLTVTYTDGSTAQVAQSFSDWFSPALKANETEAVAMPYRNTAAGTPQNVQFNLYGYSVPLDIHKQVKSVTLPNNRSVIVLAATLSAQDFGTQVNLASAYNVTGIYTDGTAFAASAGLDAGGYAYSANVLGDTAANGKDVVVGSSSFHLGAANLPDAVSAAGQTIPIPQGTYRYLKLLGTGVGGNQTAQAIQINYTDGSSETIAQDFSDWYALGNYPNESLAIRTAYRDANDGSQGNQAFNIYLYTFKLNPRKTVKSVTLPNNRKVVLLGITLAPPSIFELDRYGCTPKGHPLGDTNIQ